MTDAAGRRGFAVFALIFAGCGPADPPPAADPAPPTAGRRIPNSELPVPNSPLPPVPKNWAFTEPFAGVPRARPVPLPAVHGAAAIWGATGRDHRGHVYFGVSCDGAERLSAHLISYDPATGGTRDRGGAIENLKRLDLWTPGEEQNKIHSRIWQMPDGYLYFASLDEGGENEDGSKPPTFGSHLWRVKPDGDDWDHVAAVREAVIAAAVGGKYVFYLAYFGHVLYRYDTETTALDRMRVGSVGGHTTRNILADDRGHVFVPRVAAGGAVSLVEYDTALAEVAATPLADYSASPDAQSHGIVGVAALKGGAWVFVTDGGRLYRLDPRATGTVVTDLGYLHPAGRAYVASLFSPDGETQLVGVGRVGNRGPFEWVTYDLAKRAGTAARITLPVNAAGEGDEALVYGSIARDDAGRFYFGGRHVATVNGERKSVPAAWELGP